MSPSKPIDSSNMLAGVSRLRPELYWNVDRELRVISVVGGNAGIFDALACARPGMRLVDVFVAGEPASIALAGHHRALRGEACSYDLELRGRTYRSWLRPTFDDRCVVDGVSGFAYDATGEIVLARSLERAEASLALAQAAAHLGSWTREGTRPCFTWSAELYALCGLAPEAAEPSLELLIRAVHPEDRLALEVALESAIEERGSYSLDTRLVRHDGTQRWVHHRGNVSVDAGGALRIIGTVLDIEARKAAEVRLARRAHYDDVTGLPNRKLLLDRLQQTLLAAQHSGAPIALLCVDLDRYKTISDTLGRATADALLEAVAPRLKSAVGGEPTIARCGTDEFAVLLGELGSVDGAARAAEQIVAAFAAPFELCGSEIYATASVGVALFPDDGETPEDLMRSASSAQRRAHESGNGTFRFYAQATHATAIERLEFEHRLRRAVEAETMTVHYQPIVDRFERPVAVEALVRWTDDRFGEIAPDRFITLAEDLGLIARLGRWIALEAIAQLGRWDRAGLPPLRLALNISSRQLEDFGLAAEIATALERWNVAADRVELEITESAIIRDVVVARRAVAGLKSLGVRIALDDFGTGYSSLSYLKHFAVDALKIDRAFVADLPRDRGDAAIVTAVVALGHAMGLTVVAEGVETAEQALLVRKIGCDELQGFYFSRPLPPEDFERVIRAWSGSVRTR